MTTEPNIGPVPIAEWEKFVRLPMNSSGRDFRVALADDALVGVVESHLKVRDDDRVRFVKIVVDPVARRQGIGSALLKDLLRIDGPGSPLRFQGLLRKGWSDGEAFLVQLGFTYIESDVSMYCNRLIEPAIRNGNTVDIERAEAPVQYSEDVARIHNAAFDADVAFRPFTGPEMAEDLRCEGDDLWLARVDGKVIGFCRIEREPNLAWLESIAIDPDFQGRAIGPQLAYRALSTSGVGCEVQGGLQVSSRNPNARRVYERLGFTAREEKRRYAVWRDDLAAVLAVR